MNSKISNPWDNEYNDHQVKSIYEPLWNILKKFLLDLRIDSVLDYGCGDGNYSFLMCRMGLSVLGIDISEKAIDKAILNTQVYGLNRCKFICNDQIPNNLHDSFDVVVMLNSYHCLKNKERSILLDQIKKVMRAGGYLFLSVLALDDESYPRKEWREIEANTFNDGNGKIFHFFSFEELSMELNGFDILDNTLLQNVHPEIRRKSALYVITARSKK